MWERLGVIGGEAGRLTPTTTTNSDEAKDLIKRCLVVDATKRISAAQVMKHPWMVRKDGPKSLWKKKLIRSGRSLTEHLSDYQKRRKALRAKVSGGQRERGRNEMRERERERERR